MGRGMSMDICGNGPEPRVGVSRVRPRYQKSACSSTTIVPVRHAPLPSVCPSMHLPFCPLSFHYRSTSASLPSQSFWNKFKNKKSDKDSDYREKQSHMALARQRLLTLAYGDMETVRVVSVLSLCPSAHSWLPSAATKLSCEAPIPNAPPFPLLIHSRQELEAVARDWTKPPPDAIFSLRVPTEFASLHASVRPSISRLLPPR